MTRHQWTTPIPIGRDAHSHPAARCAVPLVLAAALLVAMPVIAQHLTGQLNLHDPSSIVEYRGRYFLFYTGRGIGSKTSTDLLHWNEGPRVFAAPPAWTSKSVPANRGRFWAPDVAFFNGKYHLYFSVSSFGSQQSAIGLTTNPTLDRADPDYAWTDCGPVIESRLGSAYNAIDPSIVQTSSGNVWMSFGSFWNGIYLVPIDPASGLRLPRSEIYHLAHSRSIEAPYIHEHDGHFYLFVNWGICCRGVDSTYNIRVGRSTSITGPYLDREGVGMLGGGGTLFLDTEGKLVGPGHVSLISRDGSDWIGYHYYDRDACGISKYNLRALLWDSDGWPVAGPAISPPKPGRTGLKQGNSSIFLPRVG